MVSIGRSGIGALQYFGYDVDSSSGCCGMAGALVTKQNILLFLEILERWYYTAVREAPGDVIISTPGFSARLKSSMRPAACHTPC
jgi:hypothetical protein